MIKEELAKAIELAPDIIEWCKTDIAAAESLRMHSNNPSDEIMLICKVALHLEAENKKLQECREQNSHYVSSNLELLRKLDGLEVAVREAEEIISGWTNLTDTDIFKHPWNGNSRVWLDRFGTVK